MSQDHTYSKLHQLSGPVLHFDLKEKSRAILEEARLADNGHAAETLAKEGLLRLTILGFTAGSALSDHQAGGPLSLEVFEGQITVATGDESWDVLAGEALILEPAIRHSVVAKTDAVVLLTIALSSN